MFRRANIDDLYALADPDTCNQYILIASDALEKLFAKQMLYPHKKGGLLFFQRDKVVKKGQQESCKELAFFFIRIFQTYAALTLSILDSEMPTVDPIDYIEKRDGSYSYDRASGFAPGPLAGFGPPGPPGPLAAKQQWLQAGGELTPRSGSYYIPEGHPYALLNQYLIVPTEGQTSNKDMKFSGVPIRIPQRSLYTIDPNGARAVNPQPTPVIIYELNDFNEQRTVQADLHLSEGSSGIRVELHTLSVNPGGEKTVGQVKSASELVPRFYGDTDPRTRDGKNLPQLLKDLLDRGVRDVLGDRFSVVRFFLDHRLIDSADSSRAPIRGTRIFIKSPSSHVRDSSVPIVYTDRITIDGRSQEISIKTDLEISRGKNSVDGRTKYVVHIRFDKMETTPEGLQYSLEFGRERWREFTAKDDRVEPRSEKDQKIPEFLQETFEKILSEKKEDGGIVLRKRGASGEYGPRNTGKTEEPFKIQRLWEALSKRPKAHCVARATQLLSVSGQYSSVCNLKFPYIQNKSLPTPGESILKEEGLYALSKLFVDGIVGASPIITSAEKFQLFGQRMKQFFERYDRLENVNTMPKSLAEITDKRPAFCGTGMERILVEPRTADALRQKARALLDRQAIHVRNVMRLMFQLFNEKQVRAGVFEMNPMIIQGGTEMVNKIAEVARELLIQYYGDCEQTYNEGVKILGGTFASADAAKAAKAVNLRAKVPEAKVAGLR